LSTTFSWKNQSNASISPPPPSLLASKMRKEPEQKFTFSVPQFQNPKLEKRGHAEYKLPTKKKEKEKSATKPTRLKSTGNPVSTRNTRKNKN